MPPDPLIESMLQTMMTSMFNPDHKSVVVCSGCSKAKGTQHQQSSPTSCKCSSNRGSRKHKKLSRKLKTIVCVAKMAKNGGECRENPTNEVEDERFCSKCGQLRPGENNVDQFSIEIAEYRKQLELYRQECNKITKNLSSGKTVRVDKGVQVDLERKKPVTVRIRVCPCPNGTKSRGNLNQSRSEPDMSKTNIAYDDTSTSYIPQNKIPHAQYEDDYYASPQLQPPHSAGINETPNWQTDISIMKRLALKIARAKLVEDAARCERAYASRVLQQQQDLPRELAEESYGELPEALVNSRKMVELGEGPRTSCDDGYLSFEDVPAEQPSVDKTRMSRATVIPSQSVYHLPPDVQNEFLATVNHSQYHIPTQNNMSAGCCAGTGVYYYSPQNPSPYRDCCEDTCSCTNTVPFAPHQPCYGYSQFQPLSDHTYM